MQKLNCLGVMALAGIAGAAGGQIGPDVIAGDITGPFRWGTLSGFTAYSIGTSSCNIGDQDLLWDDELGDGTPANLHPVMGQTIFRLKDGRFEQLGQGWVKHAFFALNFNNLCENDCDPGPNGSFLGPGCWDPYDASLNGQQGGLGAKFEINGATGSYPWPFFGDGTGGNVLFKRIRVANTDLDPALNTGALYFGEGQYVTPDDAAFGNDNNNASYRRILVGTFNNGWNLSFSGPTMRGMPAIQAWADNDPSVEILSVDVPSDGRFWIAYKVTDLGDGTFDYEYAVQNLNSDRSGGEFRIPFGEGATITNIGFHDVDYHSGEPFDNANWTSSIIGNEIVWTSPQPHFRNPDSNALRWGTLYNFRFRADAPPTAVTGTLGLFKPGMVPSVTFAGVGPQADAPPCLADVNGDGMLSAADFSSWVTAFNAGAPECDQNADGQCTAADFSSWVANFNAGC
jgi:hypothetical protein